ncbi:hypothetical protein, partial [Motilimonas sp. E26]|uniref:hypothetical protein n=1 Tax=Motilimonas sp. E26 TaxID=2865674 RepID=UPI001E30BE2D
GKLSDLKCFGIEGLCSKGKLQSSFVGHDYWFSIDNWEIQSNFRHRPLESNKSQKHYSTLSIACLTVATHYLAK